MEERLAHIESLLSISQKNIIQNREEIINNLNNLANEANSSNIQSDIQKKEKRAGGNLIISNNNNNNKRNIFII